MAKRKADLLAEAHDLGLEVDSSYTNRALEEAIEAARATSSPDKAAEPEEAPAPTVPAERPTGAGTAPAGGKYRTISFVNTVGGRIPPNTELQLSKAEAAQLLAAGAIEKI